VSPGEEQRFKVDTDATSYKIDIFRLGYYQGNGARLVATLAPEVPLPQQQPDPIREPSTGLVDCGNWAVSARWRVPPDACSGLYIARLVRPEPPTTWRADNTAASPNAWMTGVPDHAATATTGRDPSHDIDAAVKPAVSEHGYGSQGLGALRHPLREARASHIYFVVRDPPAVALIADIVFQTSDNTWNAYNSYGGTSMYGSFGTRWETFQLTIS